MLKNLIKNFIPFGEAIFDVGEYIFGNDKTRKIKKNEKVALAKIQSNEKIAKEKLKSNEKLAVIKGMQKLTEIDAVSNSPIQRLWRPTLCWVCVFAVSYHFIMHPLLNYIFMYANLLPLPDVDTGTLMPLLTGLIGMGAIRSFDKRK